MKWKLADKVIENKISEVSENFVMVNLDYISELERYKIPYNTFSDEAKECYFVRSGKGSKSKRFTFEVNEIRSKYKNGSSYRKLAKEYNCSTRTIYLILNDKY